MRDSTIARNYAEVLLSLAKKAEDLPGWGAMIDSVAQAMKNDVKLRRFLESPRVDSSTRKRVLGRALQDRMPRVMVRFLEVLIDNRRQMLIPHIAVEYHALVDESRNRLHAQVTTAREPGEEMVQKMAAELSRSFGQEVVPHITVDPEILGGAVVRVGDVVMDGSVRRRLSRLRRQLAR
jgi:F-type H+-transporting ATPase subunit delta